MKKLLESADMQTSPSRDQIEIIEYEERYAGEFKRLNLEWIRRFFEVEQKDEEVLSNPGREIIARGGFIFFARSRNEILGTCALAYEEPGVYELAKMAVTPQAQGKHIGLRLGEAVVRKAREIGAGEVFLETHDSLVPAITLYKKLGFVQHDFPHPSPYRRANVFMRLKI